MPYIFSVLTFLLIGTTLIWQSHLLATITNQNLPPRYYETEECKLAPNDRYHALASLDLCSNNVANLYSLDIQVNETTMKRKMRVCYDYSSYRTYWVEHYLEPITEPCTSVKIQWSRKFFNDLDLDSLYGSVSSYALRGHLAPPCDFSDEDSRKATYFYLNAVPQYKNFNQGNWRELEEAIRELVNSNNLKAKVTTGTIGDQCIIGNHGLHFPQQLFKIVAFEDGSALLFIGDNSDVDVFEDVCEAIPGSGWPDVTKGRIYECAIDKEILHRLGVEPDAAVYNGSKIY